MDDLLNLMIFYHREFEAFSYSVRYLITVKKSNHFWRKYFVNVKKNVDTVFNGGGIPSVSRLMTETSPLVNLLVLLRNCSKCIKEQWYLICSLAFHISSFFLQQR